MTLKRRTLLKMFAGTALTLGGPALATTKPLISRPIPSSGEQIPSIGLGTARTFDVGPDDFAREGPRQVLRRFAAMGGALVDSSPMYGNAESVVGDLAAEQGIQDKLFYATKVWTRGREEGMRQMETSMRRMRAPRMDLIQVHNLVDWRTQLQTLYAWKAQGRVRYVGITHYLNSAFDDLERIMRGEQLDFVQLPYSIANRQAEDRLLPLAAERGIAVLVNVPFARGRLFTRVRGKPLPPWAADFDCASWAQFFLKFVLSHPSVTCPIPATSKPKHLADNMQAGFGRLPDVSLRRKMAAYLQGI